MFNDLGLDCLVNSPTHRDGNILDLLLTNHPGIIKDVNIEPDIICKSDHYCISFSLNKNVPRKKAKKQNVYRYSEADWDGLSAELNSHNWRAIFANKSIHNAWEVFKSKLDIAMRKFIPMKSAKFRYRPPWFDDEIMMMSKIKDKLHKKYKHSEDPIDKRNFADYRSN